MGKNWSLHNLSSEMGRLQMWNIINTFWGSNKKESVEVTMISFFPGTITALQRWLKNNKLKTHHPCWPVLHAELGFLSPLQTIWYFHKVVSMSIVVIFIWTYNAILQIVYIQALSWKVQGWCIRDKLRIWGLGLPFWFKAKELDLGQHFVATQHSAASHMPSLNGKDTIWTLQVKFWMRNLPGKK